MSNGKDKLNFLSEPRLVEFTDRPIARYLVCRGGNPTGLQEMVQKYIESGWIPQGGIAFTQDGTCLQAMIIYDDVLHPENYQAAAEEKKKPEKPRTHDDYTGLQLAR